MSLREALLRYYDLKTVRPDLVKAVVGEASDPGEREKGDRLLVDGVSVCMWGGSKTLELQKGKEQYCSKHEVALSWHCAHSVEKRSR